MGVSAFANVKLNGLLTKHANFQNAFRVLITLLRASTGENWHLILQAISRDRTIDFECTKKPTYQDYKRNGYEAIGCGDSGLAIFYFVSFMLFVNLIFLNLFIAIVINSFGNII